MRATQPKPTNNAMTYAANRPVLDFGNSLSLAKRMFNYKLFL
jgi:hypothetical protein